MDELDVLEQGERAALHLWASVLMPGGLMMSGRYSKATNLEILHLGLAIQDAEVAS